MFLSSLIWILFASTAFPLYVNGNIEENIESAQEWLLAPEIREPLEKVSGINGHPLAAALIAFNKSSLYDDSEYHRCINDTLFVLYSTHRVPMKMKDASVKLPDGLLEFAFTHLGNWDECVSVRDYDDGIHSFHGQMCLVNYHTKRTEDMFEVREFDKRSVYLNARESALPQLVIRMGVCLPSTCTYEHVQEMFRFELEHTQLTADVPHTACTTLDRRPLDATEWTAVGILIFFGLVIILSTMYDLIIPNDRKCGVLAAFSVISNGRKLLAAPKEGSDQTLSCLHGIRFLSMCWVVVAHRYALSADAVSTNPQFGLKFTKEWLRMIISNATISVDTFFFLSGLLVGYLFFKQAPAARRFNIPKYYLHRYIRLTPALAMMVLLSASLVDRFNWGPLWPAYMGVNRDNCRKNWWNTLLYVNNYVDPVHACVGQSWYLMVDMQLHWLSPLVIIPMTRSPKWAAGLLPLLAIIGLVASFLMSLLFELPANALAVQSEDAVNDFLKYLYVPSYTRFVPYLIGLSLGYFLADRQVRGANPRRLPFLLSAFCWIFVAALMLVPLFLGYEFLQDPMPSNAATALYNSLHRPIWAAGLAGMVFLCANGNGGAANIFLSWSGFQILGRFSYCIFLVHTTIQLTEVSAMRTSVHLSDEEILAAFASDLLISTLCAGVLSVTCESPFLVIEKELFGSSRGRLVKKENTESNPAPNDASGKIDGENIVNESGKGV